MISWEAKLKIAN